LGKISRLEGKAGIQIHCRDEVTSPLLPPSPEVAGDKGVKSPL